VLDNAALKSFDLSALAAVGGWFLRITSNPALAQCLVGALVEQIQAGEGIGDVLDTSSNNDDCTYSEVGGVLEATCL
jgi:hypothetical protein